MVTTRRQWLFRNPPPHTAEVYEHALREAQADLRASMAETGSVVMEMFAASTIRERKPADGEKKTLKEKFKAFFADQDKSKKLLEIAKDVALAVRKDSTTTEAFEARGEELLERLDKFQVEQSRELIHHVRETKLWREKIASLRDKMAHAAACPIDGAPLMRTRNRKEDLFVCTAPIVEDRPQHYFLWTLVDGAAGFKATDLAKDTLPDIDGPMQEEAVEKTANGK